MKLYFNDQAFSFELLRAVSYSRYHGASIGEALATAARIKEGDFNSWYEEFSKTADKTALRARSVWKESIKLVLKKLF